MARHPVTLEIPTVCISDLCRDFHSTNTTLILYAMFILAITCNFNPNNHPTVSDLPLLDNDTISYSIKQSKTDQMRKGHSIYIFNFQTPIQPYQTLLAYLHSSDSQARSKSNPLFTDDSNRRVTCFRFQNTLNLSYSYLASQQTSSPKPTFD